MILNKRGYYYNGISSNTRTIIIGIVLGIFAIAFAYFLRWVRVNFSRLFRSAVQNISQSNNQRPQNNQYEITEVVVVYTPPLHNDNTNQPLSTQNNSLPSKTNQSSSVQNISYPPESHYVQMPASNVTSNPVSPQTMQFPMPEPRQDSIPYPPLSSNYQPQPPQIHTYPMPDPHQIAIPEPVQNINQPQSPQIHTYPMPEPHQVAIPQPSQNTNQPTPPKEP